MRLPMVGTTRAQGSTRQLTGHRIVVVAEELSIHEGTQRAVEEGMLGLSLGDAKGMSVYRHAEEAARDAEE